MILRPTWRNGILIALFGAALFPACGRRKPAEVNAIVPSVSLNRPRAPLGSAVELTCTWKVEPTAKKIPEGYRAFVHFLDTHGVLLFSDSHVPSPPPSSWEPGKTYGYTRTLFIPVYPYVGEVEIRVGLYQVQGRGERIALKGEDTGMREYRVGKMEFLPQTENIFLVYKGGWHSPEASAQNPTLERTWTQKEALISFKNPKKDVLLYLEADTNFKAFPQPPVLTIAVGNAGLVVPIENSEVFMKKLKVGKEALGDGEWTDLRLSMNQSFVPKALGVNTDDRELGLMVYHLYLAEADKLGPVPPGDITLAGPLPSPSPAASNVAAGAKAPAKGTPAKAAPARAAPASPGPAKASPAPAKPSPAPKKK